MTAALEIKGLCKEYPGFRLDSVGFSVMPGTITGFIGRNGAGKTTTLKSILNLVHPSAGEIKYFGLDLREHEDAIKQRIGYAGGTVSWYKKKKIKDIVRVTAMFYDNWDADMWRHYCALFKLDENKTPEQLSEGMKVKLNIALALSHKAELLILDEPTSGLDPVSRDELLEVFLRLAHGGVAVLFSTHITSDLEKCADSITYIRHGRIISSCTEEEFIGTYKLLNEPENMSVAQKNAIVGESFSKSGSVIMIKSADTGLFEGCGFTAPTLEEIMVYLEREDM